MVVVGGVQAPPPWEPPPMAEIPPHTPSRPPPPTTTFRVLTDSWGGGCRIRTGCGRPPPRGCTPDLGAAQPPAPQFSFL